MLAAGIAFVCAVAVFAGRAEQPAPAKEKTAEEVFKNIKTLKGHPASDVVPEMVFMSSSLGVSCEFCHDTKAFDKDTKDEKQTAREMIAMQESINKAHFKGKREVTCNSCHHGQQHPAGAPALAKLNEPVPEAVHEHGGHKPPQLSSPTQYLDEYYAAAGGEAALEKATERTLKGSVKWGDAPAMKWELAARASGELATTIEMEPGKGQFISNGKTGWLVYPGRHTRGMSAGEVAAAKVLGDVVFPVNFKKRFTQFRAGQPEEIAGLKAVSMAAIQPGQPPVRLYFDSVSHLLLRVVYAEETPLGRNPVQLDITAWSNEDGVKLPAAWVETRPNSRATYKVDAASTAAIDDARFKAPQEAAEHH